MRTYPARVRLTSMAAMVSCAAAVSGAATLNTPESWDSGVTAGWMKHDLINERVDASLTVEGGALKVLFKKQSSKTPPEAYVMEAGAAASGGNFVGNFYSSGVTGVSFRLFCEYPAEVSVLLCSEASRRLWRYRVNGVRTGAWLDVRVPISAGCIESVNGTTEAIAWEQDLRNISWVGVSIQRNISLNAQSYSIDDFTLTGRGPDFATWMSQFPHPEGYGTGNCNSLPEGDLDGDASDNYSEWIAGTSAGDASDFFHIRAQAETQSDTGAQRTVLTWKPVEGRVYSVWRATNLAEGFAQVITDLPPTPPENVAVDDAADTNAPCFYRGGVQWPGH